MSIKSIAKKVVDNTEIYFWNNSTKDGFIKMAEILLNKGFTEIETCKFLNDIVWLSF